MQFEKITLQEDINNATETILLDKKHLDNNPTDVKKEDIILLLKKILNNDLDQIKRIYIKKKYHIHEIKYTVYTN